jgi:hypothetical protein
VAKYQGHPALPGDGLVNVMWSEPAQEDRAEADHEQDGYPTQLWMHRGTPAGHPISTYEMMPLPRPLEIEVATETPVAHYRRQDPCLVAPAGRESVGEPAVGGPDGQGSTCALERRLQNTL